MFFIVLSLDDRIKNKSEYIIYGLGERENREVRVWVEEGGSIENGKGAHKWLEDTSGHGWSPLNGGTGRPQVPQDGWAWVAGQEVFFFFLVPREIDKSASENI